MTLKFYYFRLAIYLTMNHIDKIRADIKRDFQEKGFQTGDSQTFLSPSGEFRLNTTNFWLKDPNWDLTKVEIYQQNTGQKLFDFFVNDSSFFYGWLTTNNTNYFICAEDIFGGQTIVDLTNLRMAGYSPNEDGFIWTDFYLSPDGKTLATTGCYWACPTVLKIFDFSNPLTLPLKEIKMIELLDSDEVITGWLNNSTLKMKGVKRESEMELFDNGTFRMKTISETPMEREIDINCL